MELRAVPGFGFNSWADGKPASEVRAAGMTPGLAWGESSVCVSFLLGWEFLEVRGWSY